MREDFNKMFSINSEIASLIFNSQGKASHFFGYYGISPWNYNNTKILAHRTRSVDSFIPQGEKVDLGFFDLKSSLFNKFAETTACNWQQGALLQWLPGKQDTVIFNQRKRNFVYSQIIDLTNGKHKELSRPIHSVAPNGKFGLSLNVERLHFTRRSYSYEGNYDNIWNQPIVKGDGIFKTDLASGKDKLLISTSEIAQVHPHPTMTEAKHWLDHPLISPDNSKFIFYHRWLTNNGSFFTRLYTANVDGTDVTMYPDSGMYSHSTWLDSKRFVVFGRPVGRDTRTSTSNNGWGKRAIKLILPLYKRLRNFSIIRNMRNQIFQDRYFLFSTDKKDEGTILSNKLINDGHPSFNPKNSKIMLTDTYPDSKGYQHSCLLDLESDEIIQLAWFKAPHGYNSSNPDRCDLHPRWDRSGQHICIDAMTSKGNRQIYVIKLNKRY